MYSLLNKIYFINNIFVTEARIMGQKIKKFLSLYFIAVLSLSIQAISHLTTV